MKKRMLGLLLCGVMAFSMLAAGCSSNTTTEQTADPTTTEGEAETSTQGGLKIAIVSSPLRCRRRLFQSR